jgi:DNA polymerase III subunit gamma/tau
MHLVWINFTLKGKICAMSLYQKYRAKTFSEVISQDHVKQVLQNSLIRGNYGHAYLFVGTRGAGKTSTARIFARALNCQDKKHLEKTGEPCNKCESCTLALSGSHPDIIEMDAASNRGIDEVRNLKESVDFMPSIGQVKVYIIDEVHMMTKEAFNALLKTLEEPPKHIIFLMATTELFKIPPTIISRSQVFELKFATIENIVQKIEFILKGENRKVDPEAQKLIAKLGKGSFRDTETILEKVLNSSESKEISLDEVTQILGLSQAVLIEDIKNLLYAKDLQSLQKTLQENLDEGVVQNFNYQVADEIYSDIVKSLESSTIESFNLELFNFLTSIDKDIRSTSSPKMLYIAKILNFIKDFNSSSVTVAVSVEKQSSQPEIPSSQAPRNDVEEEAPKEIANPNNPASMLRARKSTINSNSSNNLAESQSDSQKDTKSTKAISKMDFLEFLKAKNMFLYRFFVHKDFEISSGKIIIEVEKKMEQDLLRKTTTQKIISDFAESVGVELVIQIGEPKIDHRKTEEKKIEEVSKKVEDLSEGEIKEIFNLK